MLSSKAHKNKRSSPGLGDGWGLRRLAWVYGQSGLVHFASYLQFGWMNKHLSANLQLGKTLRGKKLSQKPILGAKSPRSCCSRKPELQEGLPRCVSSSQSRACGCRAPAVLQQSCTHWPCGHSLRAVSNWTINTLHSVELSSKLLDAS